MAEKNEMSEKPQIQVKHPREYASDMNPDAGRSQNLGEYSVANDPNRRTAADIKQLKLKLQDVMSHEQMQQIDILPVGTPLKQGAVYLDLIDSDLPPFTATGRLFAREDQWLIAKNETPYELWNILKGHYIT